MSRHEFARPIPFVDAMTRQGIRDIGGIDVLAASRDEAVAIIDRRLLAMQFTRVAFVNAHCVNVAHSNETYRRSLKPFLILADGVGIDLASQLLHGASFPDNLNGTDFLPYLLSKIERPLRVAMLGAAPGVVERAARNLSASAPQHIYIPVSHGYFQGEAETAAVRAALRKARADIVLVGLGVPKQELFMMDLTAAEGTVSIGVGALFDFLGGRVRRAPPMLRSLRLEWLFRMLIEPRRLWRRYIVGNPVFLLRILGERRRRLGQASRPVSPDHPH